MGWQACPPRSHVLAGDTREQPFYPPFDGFTPRRDNPLWLPFAQGLTLR